MGFHGGNLNDQPARCALPPASGPEIVRQEAAENRAGALATPNVLAVSRRTGREALGQDALKLRFVGSAELQVMVVAAAGRRHPPEDGRIAGAVAGSFASFTSANRGQDRSCAKYMTGIRVTRPTRTKIDQ